MPRLTGQFFDAVVAVFLVGNPLHKPNLVCNLDPNGGKTTVGASGISSALGQGIPQDWLANTNDVCAFGDGICDRASGFGITAQHLSYPVSQPTQNLGTKFITGQLKSVSNIARSATEEQDQDCDSL